MKSGNMSDVGFNREVLEKSLRRELKAVSPTNGGSVFHARDLCPMLFAGPAELDLFDRSISR